MSEERGSVRAGFREDYQRLLVTEWSPYLGAILLVLVVLGLMMSGLYWGVYGGLKLWGDWFNAALGLGPLLGLPANLETPLMSRVSLTNITLLLGAFAAALLSRQFLISRPPKLEYLWAVLGGSLMGVGATLADGCTTGGFYTPILHASPAGWTMFAGLLIGAVIGLKLLLWTLDHIRWGMQSPPAIKMPDRVQAIYPWLGFAVLVATLFWALAWYGSDNERLNSRAILVLAGFAIGFIMHRSRLCFARAIREPFMTGEGDMTKAIILSLAIGTPFAALLFKIEAIDPYIAIPATFWFGSLLGGILFGLGMIFAGGCASGSLWRMGEGHIKLWVAAFFFAWTGSLASALFKQAGWLAAEMNLDLVEETRVGYQAYFPAMFDGWGWAFAISGGILLLWYALVRYNESSEKFTLL
jgi:hypothetical protein